MDWKLELVMVPVTDVDRAKAFYVDQIGFAVDVDTVARARDAGRADDAARLGLLHHDRRGARPRHGRRFAPGRPHRRRRHRTSPGGAGGAGR